MFLKSTGTAFAIALMLGGAAAAHGLDVNTGTNGPAYQSTLSQTGNAGSNIDRTVTGSIRSGARANADRTHGHTLGVSPRQFSTGDTSLAR